MKFLKNILHNVFNSFSTSKIGYSARKMSGFVGVVIAIYITVFNVRADNSLHFLQSWLVFVLLCLGIVTAEQLYKLFIESKTNGKTQNDSEVRGGENL